MALVEPPTMCLPPSLWETAKSLASSWASTAELRSDCWIFLKTAKHQTRCQVDEAGSSVLLRTFKLVMAWTRPAEVDKDSGGDGGGSGRDADRREASRPAQLSFEDMKADEAIAVALITSKPPRDTGREACFLAWSTNLMLRSFRRSSN